MPQELKQLPRGETMVLVLRFRIDAVEKRSERQWTGGAGPEAQFADVDLGWFARSGRLCFALGASPCDWRVGDTLELRKVHGGSK